MKIKLCADFRWKFGFIKRSKVVRINNDNWPISSFHVIMASMVHSTCVHVCDIVNHRVNLECRYSDNCHPNIARLEPRTRNSPVVLDDASCRRVLICFHASSKEPLTR